MKFFILTYSLKQFRHADPIFTTDKIDLYATDFNMFNSVYNNDYWLYI